MWPFTEAGRFLIPLVPCLLIGAVEGAVPFIARLKFRHPTVWAACAVLAMSLPYSAYSVLSNRASAQQRSYRDFDAACAWLTRDANQSGPVMARHPGEVFWLTGRKSLSPASDDPQQIESLISRHHVAYLLVDEDRYVNSQVSPLSRFVAQRPHRVQKVWSSTSASASIAIYACDQNEDDHG